MQVSLKRKLAIGAVGVAALAGAGGTYAATRGSGDDERQAFLDDVAKRLRVSSDRLESALRGAFSDRLDAAVREGRVTRTQADEIERRMKEHGGAPPFLGPPPPGPWSCPIRPALRPVRGGASRGHRERRRVVSGGRRRGAGGGISIHRRV